MSDSNVSIIPQEYDDLRREYLLLKKELDNTKQEIYGSKRNNQLLEALQNDYQSEVELLQSKLDREKKELEEKIIQLEECNSCLKLKFTDKMHSLEMDLSKSEEENVLLKNEIEILKKLCTSNNDDTISKLNDEIFSLKNDNLIMTETSEEMKVLLKSVQKQNSILEDTLSETKQEIDELRNSLKLKKDELQNANEMIDKLNEELIFIKNELETHKNQPLEKCSQGNSLFAEVDDRRVFLQKTVNNMKQEYMAMKQERAKLIRDIRHLKVENKTLLEKWKTDLNEKDEDHYTDLKSLKDRIGVLENLLESYKKALNEKQSPSTKDSFEGFEFYSLMIKNKNKQIEELRQQLSSRTLTEILLSKALNEANEEKRKWKLEATIKINELGLLQIDGGDLGDKTKEILSTNKQYMSLKNIERTSQHDAKDCLQKLTQNSNVTKLKEIENLFTRKDNLSAINYDNLNLKPNTLRLENEEMEKENSLSNEVIPREKEMNDNTKVLVDPNPSSSNISIVVLDDDSCDDRANSDIKDVETIHTEKEDLKCINKNIISVNQKEETICSKLNNGGNDDNKENLAGSSKVDETESSMISKKVTFSANTVSPKKTGLRKCKKVFVCKPVIFNSTAK